MKSFFASLLGLGVLGLAVGCASSADGTGSSGSGSTSSASGAATLACVLTISSTPSCQAYEATGPDAARAIDSLRAGCVDQAGITAKVVDACPTANVLGGCKNPVKVEGGANVQLEVTNFFYPGSGAALGPTSVAAVKEQCASDGSEFVASP